MPELRQLISSISGFEPRAWIPPALHNVTRLVLSKCSLGQFQERGGSGQKRQFGIGVGLSSLEEDCERMGLR